MSTKYQELVKAVEGARRRDAEYFTTARTLAIRLMTALRTDLGLGDGDKDIVLALPIDPESGLYSKTGEKPPFSWNQLLRLDDAGRYHMGMLLRIGPRGDQASLLFHLMIEELETGKEYGVRYAESLPAIVVTLDDDTTFAAFADAIYQAALRHFNDEEQTGGPQIFTGELN